MTVVLDDLGMQSRLMDRIADARRRSDELFQLLQPAALYDRPIPERHRVIFYLGHLEAFDWNLLHGLLNVKSFHPEYDRLFAFGIDPIGGGLPSDQPSDWPSLEAVHEYQAKIRSVLDEGITSELQKRSVQTRDGFSLETLLNVAIEHRLMHVETLAYMFHQLPFDKKRRPSQNLPAPSAPPVTQRMIQIPAGTTKLGLSRSDREFGWDNEYEAHENFVPAFEIDQFMVTNGQYLDFVKAGGYETRALWSEADWNWKGAQGISHPAFWKKVGNDWSLQLMFEEVPLPLDWPVYVSHAEATAYARWAQKSLPTEEEWHRAAYGTNSGDQRFYPWGDEPMGDEFRGDESRSNESGNDEFREHSTSTANLGNFDFHRYDPVPVNAFPLNRSSFGVHGMLGNGWEWTSTVFAPFPGFEPFPFYRGYSADFFDGRHFVMTGGSSRTAASMLRPTFRNWFQAHYQYVYAGFRCVRR